MKVFVFGSCISRDVFNFDFPRLELVGYFSRSSFASAFGSSAQQDVCSAELKSSFQKRMVKSDFEKVALEKILKTDFDFLLIDLIDERFKLFETPTGNIVTVSNELAKTSFFKKMKGQVVPAFSSKHFELWALGWDNFVSTLSDFGLLSKVVINCGLWAKQDEKGHSLENIDVDLIEKANAHLKKMYERSSLDLKFSQMFYPSSRLIVGNSEHKWGAAPFHYVDNYYFSLINFLSDMNRDDKL